MNKPVDVVIITAADGEDEAVRLVEEGALGTWEEKQGPEGYGFKIWVCDFEGRDGQPIRFMLSHSFQMGSEAAGNAAARLVDAYKPQCLAMCGVCAGNPKRARLGDVIIADRVYSYDSGEQVKEAPGDRLVFNADIMTYPFRPQWTQDARRLTVPETAPWLAQRPRPHELQAQWLLRELLEGRDPLACPDREKLCKDWTRVLQDLEKREFIEIADGDAHLTDAGRKHIKDVLYKNAGDLPEQDDWKIHVGPIGTGSKLVRDVDIWNQLETTQRHICGLDMEASVIGLTAHLQAIDMIVVKGVMDHAEPQRHHGFRDFAARAAAEVLIGFLCKQLGSAERKTLAEILLANVDTPLAARNPGTLLSARYEIVPFFEDAHRAELEDLEKWCAGGNSKSVRLFVGPGGAGKTRLLIEWAKRLRKQGWFAGFLPDQVPAGDMDVVLASPKPTLIVVDYAESRQTLSDFLKRVAGRPVRRETPLRVVLLAREVADWWNSLLEFDESVRHMLCEHEPARIEIIPVEGALRRRVWENARSAFASALNKTAPEESVDLRDLRYGRVLYLHMAALAAVEGLKVNADSLLNEIVVHEKQFWGRQFDEYRESGDLGRADFRARAARIIAAVTLHGGLPTPEQAEDINTRVDGPTETHFLRFLRGLYPGRASEVQARFLAGLEPDLLGETLVAAVLSDMHTRSDYLERVFRGAGNTALRNGFIILGRISLRRGVEASEWVRQILDCDVEGRARPAFDAAVTLGRESAFTPLGLLLAEGLRREGTYELAVELEERVPEQTVSLREVAAWATERLLAEMPEGATDEKGQREKGRLLNNLGNRLSELGRREDALQAAQEAVDIRRGLAKERPDAFLPDLAMSLNNLGNRLSELGRREDALKAAQEAVDIRRGLAKERPDAFLPYLAASLNNLGNRLSALGRREDALKAAQEATDIYGVLAKERPDAFLPYLAASLNNLGGSLSELGRREDALKAAQEATDIYRGLAKERPDAFLPDLARSLGTLGSCLHEGKKLDQARDAFDEGVRCLRPAFLAMPEAFASLMTPLISDYMSVSQELGQEPSSDLLGPIVTKLEALSQEEK